MRVQDLQSYIGEFREWIGSHAAPSLDADQSAVVARWMEELASAEKLLAEKPELPLAFLGPSQQGKSSLINALVGANVLPVGGAIGACTCVITSIHHRSGSGYRAEIDFISLTDWRAELIAIQKASDAEMSSEDTEADCDELDATRKTALEKFVAVYCDDSLKHIAMILSDRFLGLPYDIARLMSHGDPLIIEEEKALPLRNKISRYLVGRQKRLEGQYWPLISRVRIYGDFEVLSNGAVLVDLPGLNDPNPAREQVTKKYLEEARYIWLVCNSQLGIDRVFTEVLREDRLLLRLFLEGRLGAFSVIATRVDETNLAAVLGQMGIEVEDFDGDEAAIVEYRRKEIATYIQRHLVAIAEHIAEKAHPGQNQDSFLRRVRSIPVFSVSTAAYLHEKGLMPLYKGMRLSAEESHVPKLIDHLNSITLSESYSARIEAAAKRLQLLYEQASRFFLDLMGTVDLDDQSPRSEWDWLISVVSNAIADGNQALKIIQIRFEEALNQRSQSFEARLADFDSRATDALAAVFTSWQRINWRTLRAAVQRQGVWPSQSLQKEFNLNRDLASAYIDLLPFVWDEFFGEHLAALIDNAVRESRSELHKTAAQLKGAMDMLRHQPTGVRESIEASLGTAGASFELQSRQVQGVLAAQIQRTRQTLSTGMVETVLNFMHPAYVRARSENTGAGVKARMLDIIVHHAKKNAPTLFNNMRQELTEGIGILQESIKPQVFKIVSYGAGILNQFKQNIDGYQIVAPELRTRLDHVLKALPAVPREEDDSEVVTKPARPIEVTLR